MLHGNTDHVEEFERVKDRVPASMRRAVRTAISAGSSIRSTSTSTASPGRPTRTCARRATSTSSSAAREIAPRFESMLSAPYAERLAGRFTVEVADASPDEIRQAAVAVLRSGGAPAGARRFSIG